MKIEVSIIIPIYNARKTLSKCLDSIMEQTYKDFEIVLVDDGSTDGSNLICDDYAHRFNNIIAYHQSNSGVSNARNSGITYAKGRYLTFVDADDYVGSDFLSILMQKTNADFVYANSYFVGKNHPCIAEKEYKAEIFDKHSFEKHFCKIPLAKLSPWNKLYRRSILTYHHIHFNEKLHYGEDTLFVLEFLNHCNSISLCGLAPYFYNDTPGKYKKLSHDYLQYWLRECITAYQNIISKWQSSYSKTNTLNAVISFQRNNYYWILKSLMENKALSISEKKEFIREIRSSLIPKQNAKLISKREKLTEFCLSLPWAILTYYSFKFVSLIKDSHAYMFNRQRRCY